MQMDFSQITAWCAVTLLALGSIILLIVFVTQCMRFCRQPRNEDIIEEYEMTQVQNDDLIHNCTTHLPSNQLRINLDRARRSNAK